MTKEVSLKSEEYFAQMITRVAMAGQKTAERLRAAGFDLKTMTPSQIAQADAELIAQRQAELAANIDALLASGRTPKRIAH